MAIQVEIWRQDIVENLFPANQFSAYAQNHDLNVLEGAIVHVPYAGAVPNVTKNRATVPAVVTTRTDVDINYALNEYSTDPVYLKNAEKYELSYDKRMSLIGEHVAAIRSALHDDLLQSWLGPVNNLGGLPAANIFQTTGNLVSGARQVQLADIIQLKNAMDQADVPDEGRYLLFNATLYNELFNNPQLITTQIMGQTTLPAGVVARVLGFDMLRRSYTPLYDAALNVKAKGAAPAAGDRRSIIAWSQYAVARALGEVSLFERVNDPMYYGDIYSALVRASGTRLRNNGVFVLVEATS